MTDTRVPRVGVACLVVRDGRVLLVRHKRGSEPGSWSPPGGHLDFGETPEACAARETLEETGVRVADVTFFGITNDLFDESDPFPVVTFPPRATVATFSTRRLRSSLRPQMTTT